MRSEKERRCAEEVLLGRGTDSWLEQSRGFLLTVLNCTGPPPPPQYPLGGAAGGSAIQSTQQQRAPLSRHRQCTLHKQLLMQSTNDTGSVFLRKKNMFCFFFLNMFFFQTLDTGKAAVGNNSILLPIEKLFTGKQEHFTAN